MCARRWACPIREAPLSMDPDSSASAWVMRFAPLVSPGGLVLDLACGSGRHTQLLRKLGYAVVAVDRDEEALAGLVADEKHLVDLESSAWPFAGRRFDGVVVTNYLHRPLFPALRAALNENGVLIYETFAAGNATVGRPRKPEFLLNCGELLLQMQGLRVVAYEDGFVRQPRTAFIQRICAVNSSDAAEPVRYNL